MGIDQLGGDLDGMSLLPSETDGIAHIGEEVSIKITITDQRGDTMIRGIMTHFTTTIGVHHHTIAGITLSFTEILLQGILGEL